MIDLLDPLVDWTHCRDRIPDHQAAQSAWRISITIINTPLKRHGASRRYPSSTFLRTTWFVTHAFSSKSASVLYHFAERTDFTFSKEETVSSFPLKTQLPPLPLSEVEIHCYSLQLGLKISPENRSHFFTNTLLHSLSRDNTFIAFKRRGFDIQVSIPVSLLM